jgi:hypothetical protein
LEEILLKSEIVRDMFTEGKIGLVGGVHNIKNGEVDFFKNLTNAKKEKKELATA